MLSDNGIYVRGKVTDASDGNPLEYANITAIDTLGNLRASAISHSDGEFSLRLPETGQYKVYVTFVGYRSWSKDITTGQEKDLSLGTVAMEEGEELEGAAVQATQLFSREADRFVYDVKADPDAKRMEMMDFMAKIPELERNSANGQLQFREEPIAEILIDDKENGMINAGRQYPMNFIRASYMSKIELVLPGSPEYNNERPILLITLDEPLPLGFAGRLDANGDTRGTYSPGIDLVGNTPWTGVGVNYSFGYSAPPALTNSTGRESYGETVCRLDNSSTSWNRSTSHNLGMNLFRSFFDDKVDINITLSTSRSDGESFSDAHSSMTDESGNVIRTTANSSGSRTWSPMRFNAGLSLSQQWGGSNGKLNRYTFKYTYRDSRSNGEQDMLYSSAEMQTLTEEDRRVSSTSGSREHNLNLSISLRDPGPRRLWGISAEAGYINRYYDSATDYMLYDPASGTYISETARFDGLDYRQQVAFARAIFIGSAMKRKFGYGATLHAENLDNKGMFLSNGGSPLDYNEFNVMPGVSAKFSFKGFRIGGSYSTRVRRPNVTQLNPYIDETDPENLKMGNPELKGEFTHSAGGNIGYDSRGWFSGFYASYRYSTSNNAIESITFIDADNISTTTWQNLGSSRKHEIGINVRFRPLKRLTITANGDYLISTYGFADGSTNRIESFNASISITGTFLGLSCHSVFRVNPAVLSAQSTTYELYPNWHIVLSKYFSKIHLGISLFADDILHSSRSVESTITGVGFVQHSLAQRIGRNFQLSIYWEFGKFKNPPKVENQAYDAF